MGEFTFDADSRVTATGAEGVYAAGLTRRWDGTAGAVNGGYLRARPAPGWLACRVVTRFVGGGYHEEDFEVWDSAGVLVAQSRQLALIVPL
jgi:Thioesterase-like superfamily